MTQSPHDRFIEEATNAMSHAAPIAAACMKTQHDLLRRLAERKRTWGKRKRTA